jgi:threonine aldolase
MFDFRSDTVTRPTKAMKEAMMNAEVGDDVYEDDPTIKALEHYVAQITGFEASLFVLSGTMGNQLAVMSHTQKSEAVLMHANVHVNQYEVGAIGLLSSAYPKLVYNETGYLSASDIVKYKGVDNIHFPKISVVIVENALGDGRCLNSDVMTQAIQQAHDFGYKVHMDGARLFNAHIASQESLGSLIGNADSLMFCLSKGLGAPVGSMLCGSKAFIAQARRYRKMLGGGIRQGGILAAAGIYALTHHVDRLKEDHERAVQITKMLQDYKYEVKVSHRDINMVFFKLKDTQSESDWIKKALDFDLIFSPSTHGWLRLVTHLDINDEAVMRLHQFLQSQK